MIKKRIGQIWISQVESLQLWRAVCFKIVFSFRLSIRYVWFRPIITAKKSVEGPLIPFFLFSYIRSFFSDFLANKP